MAGQVLQVGPESSNAMGTGVPGLDEVLAGGLPRHRLYLVEGEPGVGKTTLALQFLLEGARQGERVLYITLSETKEEVGAVAQSHGWSLQGLDVYELSRVGEFAEVDNTLFHPDEVELHETVRVLLAEVERVRPQRVVLDSLSELRLLAQHPLRYRRQVMAFKQYFIGRRCTVLLLDDRSGGSQGDHQIESLAHGVIKLENRSPEYGSDRRRVRISKLRGVKFSGGYHDFTIEKGGLRVFPRLVPRDHHEPFRPGLVSSAIPELDDLLAGGFDRGTSSLFLGPAGSGKSTLATQYAVTAAKRGERTAFFLFDERIPTFLARSASLGLDLAPFIENGLITLRQVDAAELTPGEFVAAVRTAVEDGGAALVVIDSINGFIQAMPEERFLSLQMHELLTYLDQQGVTSILVLVQHGLQSGAVTSPADLSYLADTVVLLRYFESSGQVRKAISVLKKRSGGHESTMREYLMGPKGIRVGPPLDEFRDVLTGVPVYQGASTDLLERTT